MLRLLLCPPAAVQAAGGQHLSGQPRGWVGQVEHGQADLLLAELHRETGSNRRVLVPEGDEGHKSEALQVSSLRATNNIPQQIRGGQGNHRPNHLFLFTPQTRRNRNGGDGHSADGLSRSNAEPVCRVVPEDGPEAAGGHESLFADTGD